MTRGQKTSEQTDIDPIDGNTKIGFNRDHSTNTGGNDDPEDSDNSDDIPEALKDVEINLSDETKCITSSECLENCISDINSGGRRISREGDVYNTTVRAGSMSSLTIGPVVDNHPMRQRKKSVCSPVNGLKDECNDSDLIPINGSSNEENLVAAVSDLEEDLSSELESPSNIEEPVPTQFDTKVDITMPNEGQPKIDIKQEITNVYHGPVYHMDAEVVKAILLENPHILAQICDRELASLPKIKHNLNRIGRPSCPKERKDETAISIEGEKSRNETERKVNWKRNSSRRIKPDGTETLKNDINQVRSFSQSDHF